MSFELTNVYECVGNICVSAIMYVYYKMYYVKFKGVLIILKGEMSYVAFM